MSDLRERPYFVSGACLGERCGYEETIATPPVICGAPAEHKVEETVFHDDPFGQRHPLTTYLCHEHFRKLMGPMTDHLRVVQTAARGLET